MQTINLVLLTTLLLAACGQTQQTTSLAIENNSSTITTHTLKIDPCDIALTAIEVTAQNRPIARYQQAVINNKQVLPNLENLGWAFVTKARHSFDTGYYKLAQQTAHCIEQKQKNSTQALMLHGHVLHQLHQFSDSEAIARKLIDQRGNWFEYGLLGDVLMEQGKLEEAAQSYQVMMDLRPGPQAYSRAAHLRWLKGDLNGAIEMMNLTIQAYGARSSEALIWSQTRLAIYLFQAKDFKNAHRVIDHTLSIHKDYAPALLAQGRMYLAQNDLQKAVLVLKQAVEINPLPEYQWLLIEALHENRQHDKAKQIMAQLHKTGAQEDRRTYALYLTSRQQNTKLALQLVTQDLETRQDVFSLDAIAWTLYTADRIPQAVKFIQRALAEGTQDARLFYHAAIIQQTANKNTQARHWFNKALALQHMLFPSERHALLTKFATLSPQTSTLVTRSIGHLDNLILIGANNENSL